MNYGPLIAILCLDLNMLKVFFPIIDTSRSKDGILCIFPFQNQILYEPIIYGQYTDEYDRIVTVTDPATLRKAYNVNTAE